MNLPFTTEQFFSVIEQYNNAVWPTQILLNFLGFAAIFFALKPATYANKGIVAILAFLWIWIGTAYHLAFFTAINPAAYLFGGLSILQGFVFLYFGWFREKLNFHFRPNAFGWTGAILIFYAMILYPLLGYSLGHIYPKTPTFGLPCPTTIFTFGVLLWTDSKIPWGVLVIPVLWSLIGFSAALTMGVSEDTGLLVAGVVGTTLIVLRDRRVPKPV